MRKLRNLFSFLKEELPKLFLFLALLYGFILGILYQPSHFPAPSLEASELASVSVTTKEGSVKIPSLGVSAPLLVVASTDANEFVEPLKQGVTLFPSKLPGQKGTAIILGHSAPLGWPNINYDWVFSDLRDLRQGEKIQVVFRNTEYTYTVTETIILQRGQEIPAQYLSGETSSIILISCWPPGINNKRIGVFASIDPVVDF